MTDDLATFFLILMPVAFLLKTAIFGLITGLLLRQETMSRLGTAINALFATTAVMSAALFGLAWVLYEEINPTDIDTALLWLVLVMVAIWPMTVFGAGIWVYVEYQRRVQARLREG